MDGLPPGVSGIPPADSVMSDDDRLAFLVESLDRAEAVLKELVAEHTQEASTLLDDAEELCQQILEEDYKAVEDAIAQAEKKAQKLVNAEAKSAGDYIQRAYDTIRQIGHYPIVDIVQIETLLAEEYPYDSTVSVMLGSHDARPGSGQGDVQLVQQGSQGSERVSASEVGPVRVPPAGEVEAEGKERYLERYALKFGTPGEVRYEIVRHGHPSPRYPDDDFVPPQGTPVIPYTNADTWPMGYVYSVGAGGYIPMSATPEGNAEEFIPLPCPPGTYPVYGEDGSVCKPDDIIPPPPPPPPPLGDCPPGTIRYGDQCIPDDYQPPNPCPPGFLPDPNTGECVPVVPPCPPGYVRNHRGDCVPIIPDVPPPPPPPPPPFVCPEGSVAEYRVQNIAGYGFFDSGWQKDIGVIRGTLTSKFPDFLIDEIVDAMLTAPMPYSLQWTGSDRWRDAAVLISGRCIPKDIGTGGGLTGCYRIIPCTPDGAPFPGIPTLPPTLPPKPPPPPPPTEPEPPPPPPAPATPPVGWDDPNVCEKERLSRTPTPDENGEQPSGCWWARSIIDGGKRVEQEAPTLFGWIGTAMAAWGEFLNGVCVNVDKLGEWLTTPLYSGTSAESSVAVDALGVLKVAGWLERLTAAPYTYLLQDARYALQWAVPQFLPAQPGMDIAFLTNQINDNQWECWTKALGNLPNSHRMVRDAQQTRLDVQQCIDLYMRKLITRQELEDELRKRGVIDSENVARWLKLRQALPTETDLIPFMTRDVVNPNIDWRASDEWYEQNYAQQVREWGDKLGIDPDVMKMRARAHWNLPSKTLADEFVARLRPGRRDDGIEFTKDDYKRLLMQNDMEPSYIDRVLATSYLPPTRTDIKMGIKTRSIPTIEEAEQLLLDARIDPVYAPTLARILWDDANRQVANESNLWSRAKVMKEYMDGMIDRDKAYTLLKRFMVNDDQIYQQLDDADDKAGIAIRRECVKAVKNRVLRAEVTEFEAASQLEALGIPSNRAASLAQGFVCYRASRGTELTIRYLSKIWKQGLVSPEELYIRFLNLRYTEEDAQLLLRSWQIDLTTEQRKEAERERKARESDVRGMRARYRTEVAWLQKQRDRLEKQQKAEPPKPIDAVDTDGRYVPGNPQPPIP